MNKYMNMLNCHEQTISASEVIGNKRLSKTPSHSEYLRIQSQEGNHLDKRGETKT